MLWRRTLLMSWISEHCRSQSRKKKCVPCESGTPAVSTAVESFYTVEEKNFADVVDQAFEESSLVAAILEPEIDIVVEESYFVLSGPVTYTVAVESVVPSSVDMETNADVATGESYVDLSPVDVATVLPPVLSAAVSVVVPPAVVDLSARVLPVTPVLAKKKKKKKKKRKSKYVQPVVDVPVPAPAIRPTYSCSGCENIDGVQFFLCDQRFCPNGNAFDIELEDYPDELPARPLDLGPGSFWCPYCSNGKFNCCDCDCPFYDT